MHRATLLLTLPWPAEEVDVVESSPRFPAHCRNEPTQVTFQVVQLLGAPRLDWLCCQTIVFWPKVRAHQASSPCGCEGSGVSSLGHLWRAGVIPVQNSGRLVAITHVAAPTPLTALVVVPGCHRTFVSPSPPAPSHQAAAGGEPAHSAALPHYPLGTPPAAPRAPRAPPAHCRPRHRPVHVSQRPSGEHPPDEVRFCPLCCARAAPCGLPGSHPRFPGPGCTRRPFAVVGRLRISWVDRRLGLALGTQDLPGK